MICSICDRTAACEISQVTNQPWCKACQKRWARCVGCGQVTPIRGGTLTEPLCAICTRPDLSFWRFCPTCGEQRQLSTRTCTRCNLRHRLHVLLDADNGAVRAELRSLHDNLANTERPRNVLDWLNKPATTHVLQELGAGQRVLSHAGLDELPASKPIEHLRAILVATNTLPPRDEHLVRLERWIIRTVADRDDADQRHLLHRYAVWYLLRRLRSRNNSTHTSHSQVVTVQRHTRAAIALLDGLTTRGRTLDDARSGRVAPGAVWLPTWYGTSPGGGSAGFAGGDFAGAGSGSGGLLSSSSVPDLGGMIAALGSIGNSPSSSGGGGSGGYGGGGSGGGGGGSGGGF